MFFFCQGRQCGGLYVLPASYHTFFATKVYWTSEGSDQSQAVKRTEMKISTVNHGVLLAGILHLKWCFRWATRSRRSPTLLLNDFIWIVVRKLVDQLLHAQLPLGVERAEGIRFLAKILLFGFDNDVGSMYGRHRHHVNSSTPVEFRTGTGYVPMDRVVLGILFF